jgi:hypothetical protein
MKAHYEVLTAKQYYGRHSTGWVLLRNGYVMHHGTRKEVMELYNTYAR